MDITCHARRKTSTFESRQRALRRKYALDDEIKRFEAFLESENATALPRSNQAPTMAVPTPSFAARSQIPASTATVSDPPPPPDDIDMHDTESTEHHGTWVSSSYY